MEGHNIMNHADNQNFAKLFGEFIRQGRSKQKINQQDLAAHLGLTQSYLSRLEQGTRSVDLELAIKICSFLQLDLNDFLKQNRSE